MIIFNYDLKFTNQMSKSSYLLCNKNYKNRFESDVCDDERFFDFSPRDRQGFLKAL